MDSDKAMERAQRRLAALSDQLQGFESRLTSVSRTTRQATQAVGAAGKAAQAVATLLEFDEINRLKEKSAGSSGSGRKSGSGSGSGSSSGAFPAHSLIFTAQTGDLRSGCAAHPAGQGGGGGVCLPVPAGGEKGG